MNLCECGAEIRYQSNKFATNRNSTGTLFDSLVRTVSISETHRCIPYSERNTPMAVSMARKQSKTYDFCLKLVVLSIWLRMSQISFALDK